VTARTQRKPEAVERCDDAVSNRMITLRE